MKTILKNIIVFTLALFMLASFFSLYEGKSEKADQIGLQEVAKAINEERAKSIVIRGDKIEVVLADETIQSARKEIGASFVETMAGFGAESEKLAKVDIQVKDEEGAAFWLQTLAPFLFPFLLLGFLIFMMMRGVQGANSRAMGFGQAQPKVYNKDENTQVTFKDVAGVKEAKEELGEVVEFLKHPKKFIDLGAKIPRGVLLLGSPGAGKTLMARAVAGEAGVAFFHISGSEFVEMFVGVGASRVRSLFQSAKKAAPCIIFVDEIDAVGRKRGAGLGGSHDEREQTLNQILVEMDGFDPRDNVIVMAATNRPDVLDPALLRPGRFDRQVILDDPDIEARTEILKIHAVKKPFTKEVELRRVAERTPGFSGADLANLLNESAILAARRNKKDISMDELFEAIEKVMLGPERKSRVLNVKEKEITAYHEAGHAVVTHLLPNADPVHKVSIISRGRAGGYTLKLPSQDKYMHSKTEFCEEIAVLLGGFVAEKEFFGDVTTGATSDLRRATNLARRLITDYGMSNTLGPRTFGEKEEMIFLGREIHEQRDYSEKTAEAIDKEISAFIAQGEEMALKIIKKEKMKIKSLVEILIKKETLEKEEFEKIMGAKK